MFDIVLLFSIEKIVVEIMLEAESMAVNSEIVLLTNIGTVNDGEMKSEVVPLTSDAENVFDIDIVLVCSIDKTVAWRMKEVESMSEVA